MSFKNKTSQLILFFALLSIASVQAQQAVEPGKWLIKEEPSTDFRYQDDIVNEVNYSHYCYNYTTGRPMACKFEYQYLGYDVSSLGELEIAIGCSYDDNGLADSGTCGNGGHSHENSRPTTYMNSPVKLLNADDEDASSFGVKGVQPTAAGEKTYRIVLDAPEAAGYYNWEMNVKMPAGFAFAGLWGTNGVSLNGAEQDTLGINKIAMKKMFHFPDDPNHVKVRTPDSRHVDQDAFQVRGAMANSINALSFEYRILSGNKDYRLSFNDMSLPLGGLFDINGGWIRPHGSHRLGEDADINKVPGNAENGFVAPPCEEDYLLHRAAEIALLPLGNRPSPVLCESGNRRHLDFSPLRSSS